MSMYLVATMADLSKMTPAQVSAHMDGIEYMKAQLGIVMHFLLALNKPASIQSIYSIAKGKHKVSILY